MLRFVRRIGERTVSRPGRRSVAAADDGAYAESVETN